MMCGDRVNQLGGDTDLFADLSNASLQDVPDAQLAVYAES